eukprot:TRINITY_DN48918_c0_g1_i1.p2 TRINITY_DN48918_c0_g1~~TRINITY_DN48918_c0_g1_i1.p2  ORF type:complete len:142 (-),score=42.47 TRINITY_DN48918_c0_g1_i1:288-713(-)
MGQVLDCAGRAALCGYRSSEAKGTNIEDGCSPFADEGEPSGELEPTPAQADDGVKGQAAPPAASSKAPRRGSAKRRSVPDGAADADGDGDVYWTKEEAPSDGEQLPLDFLHHVSQFSQEPPAEDEDDDKVQKVATMDLNIF